MTQPFPIDQPHTLPYMKSWLDHHLDNGALDFLSLKHEAIYRRLEEYCHKLGTMGDGVFTLPDHRIVAGIVARGKLDLFEEFLALVVSTGLLEQIDENRYRFPHYGFDQHERSTTKNGQRQASYRARQREQEEAERYAGVTDVTESVTDVTESVTEVTQDLRPKTKDRRPEILDPLSHLDPVARAREAGSAGSVLGGRMQRDGAKRPLGSPPSPPKPPAPPAPVAVPDEVVDEVVTILRQGFPGTTVSRKAVAQGIAAAPAIRPEVRAKRLVLETGDPATVTFPAAYFKRVMEREAQEGESQPTAPASPGFTSTRLTREQAAAEGVRETGVALWDEKKREMHIDKPNMRPALIWPIIDDLAVYQDGDEVVVQFPAERTPYMQQQVKDMIRTTGMDVEIQVRYEVLP